MLNVLFVSLWFAQQFKIKVAVCWKLVSFPFVVVLNPALEISWNKSLVGVLLVNAFREA
jgi:hypothetical protein